LFHVDDSVVVLLDSAAEDTYIKLMQQGKIGQMNKEYKLIVYFCTYD